MPELIHVLLVDLFTGCDVNDLVGTRFVAIQDEQLIT
jgi:hypothetical protein